MVGLALLSGCGSEPSVTLPTDPAPLPNPDAIQGGNSQSSVSVKK